MGWYLLLGILVRRLILDILWGIVLLLSFLLRLLLLLLLGLLLLGVFLLWRPPKTKQKPILLLLFLLFPLPLLLLRLIFRLLLLHLPLHNPRQLLEIRQTTPHLLIKYPLLLHNLRLHNPLPTVKANSKSIFPADFPS